MGTINTERIIDEQLGLGEEYLSVRTLPCSLPLQ
jgi:hypothetical protein